jgi:pyrroloquinoline quinone biosynthesis protein E
MMPESDFQSKYGALYDRALSEAREYVSDPSRLKADIERKAKAIGSPVLRAPSPDQSAYLMMRYMGFVRYPERLRNFIAAESEPRSASRSFMPHIMDVEPNSRCNFRCAMCQVSGWKNGKRAPDLTLGAFKGLMGELLPLLTEVKLQGMGDPLLNKDFFEMCEYLAGADIWIRTSINGSLLHLNENYRRLIDSGVGEVQASFDGATKEVYEGIRKRSSFEQVVRNFTMLNDYANKKDRLYTRMWVLLHESNRGQLPDFVLMAKKMGFRRLSFSTLHDWGQEDWKKKNDKVKVSGLSEEEKMKLAESARREDIDITLWETGGKYYTQDAGSLCPWPFGRLYISSDLRVVPCCMIGNPDIADFGDARELKKIWNGPAYAAFREAHMQGKIPAFCRNCYK